MRERGAERARSTQMDADERRWPGGGGFAAGTAKAKRRGDERSKRRRVEEAEGSGKATTR
jgi:hypothetical protein